MPKPLQVRIGHSPDPDDEEIMDALGGQICRCTGYQAILASVRLAINKKLRDAPAKLFSPYL